MDDIILNKLAIIQRCLQRIEEEYRGFEDELEANFTKQDSIVLNLQRACEASIDLAARVVRMKKLGLPQRSRDVFVFLAEGQVITKSLSQHLQGMVGFRNVAVHDYQELNLEILKSILNDRLGDFESFAQQIRQYFS